MEESYTWKIEKFPRKESAEVKKLKDKLSKINKANFALWQENKLLKEKIKVLTTEL